MVYKRNEVIFLLSVGKKNIKTFGLTTYRDVLAKLDRELERLDAAETLKDAADHGTNAAITAWHLVDWTWSALKSDSQLCDRIAKDLGARWNEPNEFKRWLVEHGCRELRHCQMITTSLKHSGFNSKPSDPDFTALPGPVSAEWVNDRGEIGTWINAAGDPVYWTVGNDSEWWIIEGDQNHSANLLLRKVRDFWWRFIERYAIP
jgi:hypothetical protein